MTDSAPSAPTDGHNSLPLVQPEAREIVAQLASLCKRQFGPDLRTLLIHGSAAKGGIIPGSSDLDFVMIVEPGLLTPVGELPFERAVEFHAELARIEPAPFLYLQGNVYAHRSPKGIGFIPGTYHVVAGNHDVPLATSETLIESAQAALARFDPDRYRDDRSNALLNHGETRLYRQVRWMCTDIWPMAFHIATLVEGDGIRAWQRTKHQTVAFLAHDPTVGGPLQQWLDTVSHHYAAGETTATALEALSAGVAFLDAASRWYRSWVATGSALRGEAMHNS
jgi:hypothetical protein